MAEDAEITVVNVYKAAPGSFVYIGRAHRQFGLASPLANPFSSRGNDALRPAVIEQFRQWLLAEVRKPDSPALRELDRLARLVQAGQPIALGCFCKPKACHGDVVARAIRWRLSQI